VIRALINRILAKRRARRAAKINAMYSALVAQAARPGRGRYTALHKLQAVQTLRLEMGI